MNPRTFFAFFKTGSGRLLVFAALLAAGLALLGWARGRHHEIPTLVPRRTNAPAQVVETVQRPMEPFRPPPPPRPSPRGAGATNAALVSAPEKRPELPISLVADKPEEPVKGLSPVYAPYGRLIPCETVITVDSSSIQTPIIGLITEDIYHQGRVVIPAGTEVHGQAQQGRTRERLASGGSWTLVWQTGEELRLRALALDREFGTNSQWGITDGSAGLRGQLIASDDLAEIKLFAATFLSGAAKALTERESTLLGPIDSPSLNNAPLKGAEDILARYAQRIHEAIQRDGYYLRIPSGKQFYLYVLQTIDRADARLAGARVEAEVSAPTLPRPE